MLRTLAGDDERYVETYFKRFGKETYLVGDAARRDEDGYFWILGRIDDVINVSGHRMSTAEIESAIVSFEKVAESAVVAKQDDDTGQAVVAFVSLSEGEGSEELEGEVREHVAKKIGKLARPKQVIWTADLPKTRSGKIMRRLLRDLAEGRQAGDVSTLSDPGVMDRIAEQVGQDDEEGDDPRAGRDDPPRAAVPRFPGLRGPGGRAPRRWPSRSPPRSA
jgi:acetyl-CoA synthetase